jgi:hypothetical protein
MTNQRLMAQYGFVPPHGNTADRLAFAALSSAAEDAAGSSQGGAPATTRGSSGGGGGGGGSPVLLSIDRLQACLGNGQLMAAAFSGRDPYFYAALKVRSQKLGSTAACAAATRWHCFQLLAVTGMSNMPGGCRQAIQPSSLTSLHDRSVQPQHCLWALGEPNAVASVSGPCQLGPERCSPLQR